MGVVAISVAQRPVSAGANGEGAPAALLSRPGLAQHFADGTRSGPHAGTDVAVAHDGALAQDHEVRVA